MRAKPLSILIATLLGMAAIPAFAQSPSPTPATQAAPEPAAAPAQDEPDPLASDDPDAAKTDAAKVPLDEIRRYNAAVRVDIPFDPNVKDGRRTEGLAVNKSNWANTIDEPPFEAYQVGCGITFTFGGLRIDTEARVLDADQAPIPGLYACGELVGGIFYFNYPGGSGLINGAVFGRVAGATAVADARSNAGGGAAPPPVAAAE